MATWEPGFAADIDILVPPQDAVRARRVILANGYSSEFTEEFFARRQLHTTSETPAGARDGRAYLPGRTSLDASARFIQKSGGHGRICGPRPGPREFLRTGAYDLTPEWQFLYLSFHAAYHKWSSLKWLADIHELCVSATGRLGLR